MGMLVTWLFGSYIQRLIDQKGWKLTRLAKESGVSYAYLTYLVKGEDPNTGKPPSPTLDKVLAISKALSVQPIRLLLAYQGIDPDEEYKNEPKNSDEKENYKLFQFFELLGARSLDLVTADNLRLALSRVEINRADRNCHFGVREKIYKGVRSFMRHLIQVGMLAPSEREATAGMKPRRIYEPTRNAPDMADVESVLQKLNHPSRGKVAYDRTLTQTAIAIMAMAGLRRAELLALTVDDIDMRSRVITVADGKGHKSRQVGMESALYNQLGRYLQSRTKTAGDVLLVMASGKPLTQTSLVTRLKRLQDKAGVVLSPHALRRAFITYNLGQGVPLVVVQRLAGHSDAKMTQIYDRTTADAAMDWLRRR